jgi:glycosyltransferase involved in cell wall biosynthesis
VQKVSIIMPVYNAANFLQKSVTSLLQQTYSNKEIIIVDDSSSDNSYAIAQSFESENVTVLQQPNAGAAVARNTGLTHASGDYIQFMDVDDFLSPDKIEKQVEALKGNKNKIAVCNYTTFTDDAHLNVNMINPGLFIALIIRLSF